MHSPRVSKLRETLSCAISRHDRRASFTVASISSSTDLLRAGAWHPEARHYVDRLKLTVTVSTKRSGLPFNSSGE
jgi:hypothetical protein